MPLTPVTHAHHSYLAAQVIASGHLQDIQGLLDGYDPALSLDQVHRITRILIAEARSYGLPLPLALVRDLVFMQALMVPTQDDALALTLGRLYTFIAYCDDLCSRDRPQSWNILTSNLNETTDTSPYAAYRDHTFQQLAPFCDPAVLGILRGLFLHGNMGVLLETQFDLDIRDNADTEYIRGSAGYNELWGVTLQFAHPSLAFLNNLRYWAATCGLMSKFIADINDVCSFYKESLDGDDFAASRIYRISEQTGIPYLHAYRNVLNRAITCGNRAHALADPEQQPYVKHFQQGYIYFHVHTDRYRWHEIVPTLSKLEIPGECRII